VKFYEPKVIFNSSLLQIAFFKSRYLLFEFNETGEV